jgi:adenine-specific DNA-methyltransferase
VWTTLYLTVPHPFARPDTAKIAVKVNNDYDDEVMQVVEVT